MVAKQSATPLAIGFGMRYVLPPPIFPVLPAFVFRTESTRLEEDESRPCSRGHNDLFWRGRQPRLSRPRPRLVVWCEHSGASIVPTAPVVEIIVEVRDEREEGLFLRRVSVPSECDDVIRRAAVSA